MSLEGAAVELPPILEVEDQPICLLRVATPPRPDAPCRSIPSEFQIPAASSEESKRVLKTSTELSPLPNINDHGTFWSTYDKAAGTFDAELLHGWNKSLDILLIFAGLFSAINTAFIIESYKALQSDPTETTNALLRLLITHRNDDITLTIQDLNPGSASPSAVSINSIFFSSLSFSLTAAFGAVNAKQWLTDYANVGSIKTLHVQGRERQAKFKGLKTWHFQIIIEILPILLQISLLLFLVGVVKFLWVIDSKVAVVQLVLSAVAVAIYISTVVISIVSPTSPFQTPLSRYLPQYWTKLLKHIKTSTSWRSTKRLWEAATEWWKSTGIYVSFRWWSWSFRSWWVSTRVYRVAKRWRRNVMRPWQSSHSFSLGTISRICRRVKSRGRRLFRSRGSSNLSEDEESKESGSLSLLDDEEADSINIYPGAISGWDAQDVLAGESVVWLLQQIEYPEATLTALDAALRLSPDLLLSLIDVREGLLDRLVMFHNSLLPQTTERGIKWVEAWDNRAIVSGMALLHIFKAALDTDGKIYRTALRSETMWFTVDMGHERWEDPTVLTRVIIAQHLQNCLARYMFGSNRSLHNGFSLISSLTPLFSSSMHSTQLVIDLADTRQTTATRRLITSITPLQLVLDALVTAVFNLNQHDVRSNTLTFTRMLQFLNSTLQAEQSSDLISHIAIVIAALQLNQIRHDSWNHDAFQGRWKTKRSLIQFTQALDKSPMLVENVIRAFSLIDMVDVHPIYDVYGNLLVATEDLVSQALQWTPHAPSVPHKNLLQGLLRLSRKTVDDADTQDRILRLLSWCSDWRSPTLLDYVDDFVQLLKIALSSSFNGTNLNQSAFNRLLGKLAEYSDETLFSRIFLSAEGLFPHSYSTAAMPAVSEGFLYKMLSFGSTHPYYSPALLGVQFTLSIKVLAELHLPIMEYDPQRILRNIFNQMINFPQARQIRGWDWLNEQHRLHEGGFFQKPDPDSFLDTMPGDCALLLWNRACIELREGRLPANWDDSAFFGAKVVDMMLEYFHRIERQNWTGIDRNILLEYFSTTLGVQQQLDRHVPLSTFGADLHEGLTRAPNVVSMRGLGPFVDMESGRTKAVMVAEKGNVLTVMTEDERRRSIQEALSSLALFKQEPLST